MCQAVDEKLYPSSEGKGMEGVREKRESFPGNVVSLIKINMTRKSSRV